MVPTGCNSDPHVDNSVVDEILMLHQDCVDQQDLKMKDNKKVECGKYYYI